MGPILPLVGQILPLVRRSPEVYKYVTVGLIAAYFELSIYLSLLENLKCFAFIVPVDNIRRTLYLYSLRQTTAVM